MIRLLLGAALGWAAWRNRSRIREYVNRLNVQTRAAEVLDEGTERIKEGLQAPPGPGSSLPLGGRARGTAKAIGRPYATVHEEETTSSPARSPGRRALSWTGRLGGRGCHALL
jgi:hypothetical protein